MNFPFFVFHEIFLFHNTLFNLWKVSFAILMRLRISQRPANWRLCLNKISVEKAMRKKSSTINPKKIHGNGETKTSGTPRPASEGKQKERDNIKYGVIFHLFFKERYFLSRMTICLFLRTFIF